MTHFLITSTLSLGALLAVYYLLLQREKMHRFNRVYLLASVMFSMALPFISIPVYKDAPAPVAQVQVQANVTPAPQPAPAFEAHVQDITRQRSITALPAAEPQIDYTPYVLWGLYGVVALLLALRFVFNIRHLYRLASHNEQVKTNNGTLVLLDDCPVPYTFLQYIFISKEEYANRAIEQELLAHEATHVRQRHTLDILFIEALKTVLWFNPLLYIYKHAIQLNHEFLADATVVTPNNVITYQQLLLQRATPRTSYALASSLNFSITKKRFTMMTKATTKNRALLLKLAALPVLAGLVYALSIETVAQQPQSTTTLTPAQITVNNSERDAYYSGVRVVVEDKVKGISFSKMYEELTDAEKDRYMFDVPLRLKKKHPTATQFESYKDKKTYAIWIDGKNLDNSVLASYKPEDFALFTGSSVYKNARTKQHPQPYQFSFYTHDYYDKHFKTFHYPGDTYQMNLSKEFKNGVEVGKTRTEITNPATGSRTISQLEYEQAPVKALEPAKNLNLNETMPQYPGGDSAFIQFIGAANRSDEVVFPKSPVEVGVDIFFTVETDGTMS
ncbi:MAG: M56 family metallopeptidase, partial [Sphingobacteriales bacterium]